MWFHRYLCLCTGKEWSVFLLTKKRSDAYDRWYLPTSSCDKIGSIQFMGSIVRCDVLYCDERQYNTKRRKKSMFDYDAPHTHVHDTTMAIPMRYQWNETKNIHIYLYHSVLYTHVLHIQIPLHIIHNLYSITYIYIYIYIIVTNFYDQKSIYRSSCLFRTNTYMWQSCSYCVRKDANGRERERECVAISLYSWQYIQ